jgi:hypothetical protein
MIKMNYIKPEEALMYKYRINAWAISSLCHEQTMEPLLRCEQRNIEAAA